MDNTSNSQINEQKNDYQPELDMPSENIPADGKKTLAVKLLEELLNIGIIFFHDQYKNGYAALKGNGSEVIRLNSKSFKQWVYQFAWESTGKIPYREAVSNVINTLEGKSVFDGKLYELAIRIKKHEDAIWYDLANGQAIRIDGSGWEIVYDPPIIFRRISHQSAQVVPERNGKLSTLLKFINLNNEAEQLLFLVYTVAAFIPDFPHPLLLLYGAQGAGKTTPLRVIKSLTDPSVLKTLTAPDSLRDFIQLASHHSFLFLDNLSTLPNWLSDALARASTGDGFSKRELYSDDEDIIYVFQRAIGLNGINLVIEKADLLDRSILLHLERIPKNQRKEESKFWEEFEKEKPLILGAIFDVVSKAIQLYPTISLSEYPRMADFARWGCAISNALGYTEKDFLDAYYANINYQNDAAIEASSVGTAVDAFMKMHDVWNGTATELLSELENQPENAKLIKARDWPKDPAWLTKRLEQVQTNLAEKGIEYKRDDKSRPRKILLSKKAKNTDDTDISLNTQPNGLRDIPTVQKQIKNYADEDTDENNEAEISTPTETTVPTVFSPTYKNELIAKEKELREHLAIKDKNTSEYMELYRDWMKTRDEGIKLGIFSGMFPLQHE